MEYLKKLEEDKIRLEDLIDVIDDTSEETDALVQEMMEVRNAFYHITFDDNVPLDTNGQPLSMIQCILNRYHNFQKYVKTKDRLAATIQKCINNLDTISHKISSQADRATKTLQTMESFKLNMIVQIIQKDKEDDISHLSFATLNQQLNTNEVLTTEDLQILCNRYRYIKNNKSNVHHKEIEEDQSDKTIILILNICQEIHYLFDNLRNLGHPNSQYQSINFKIEGTLDELWINLQGIFEKMTFENDENQEQLEKHRQTYISLNLFPPSQFKNLYIIFYEQNMYNDEQKLKAIEEIKNIANSFNEDEHFIKKLQTIDYKDFVEKVLAEADAEQLTKGFQLFGHALNKLIQLPQVNRQAETPQYLKKFTNGDKIQSVRMNHKNELWQNIFSIFLGHNQTPHSWQIMFCTAETQIYELEQFAQLAKNINILNQNKDQQILEEVKPLFVIISFENLPLKVQRDYVDILENMYEQEERAFINLLITYFGSSGEIIDKFILEQFRNQSSYIEKYRMNTYDLKRYVGLNQLQSVSLYWSKFSGYGKTYQIYKSCREKGYQNIEIPVYGETKNQELLQLIKKKISSNDLNKKLHFNLYPMNRNQDLHAIMFQLLVMRKFSTSLKNFVKIPSNILINLEIQNSFRGTHEKDLEYLQFFLPLQNRFFIDNLNLQLYDISEDPRSEIQISLKYLKAFLVKDCLNNFVVEDNQKENKIIIRHKEAIELIQTNLMNSIEHNPSFYHLTCILKFFTNQVMLFNKCGQLHPQTLEWLANKGGDTIEKSYRCTVFKGIVQTSVTYSCQIQSNNYSMQEDCQVSYYNALEKRNQNIFGWDDTRGAQDQFFQTFSEDGTLVEIYNDPQLVPEYLKKYYKANGRLILDWDDPKNDKVYLEINKDWKPKNPSFLRDQVLVQLCTKTRLHNVVRSDLDQNFNHLALTKTIARKICFLFIKISCKIPTLIMGETGIGKTILIQYLSKLVDGEIFTLNVHAGQTQNDIINWLESIIFLYQLNYQVLLDKTNNSQILSSNEIANNTKMETLHKIKQVREREMFNKGQIEKKNIILFLDEINTNENINGVLKEILIDRKIKGVALPNNFIPIAAANPYKFKTKQDQEDNTDSLKIRGCENKTTSRLVYHVHPLPESMNTFIWDFGQLQKNEETKIVSKMIEGQCTSIKMNFRIPNFHKTLLQTITNSQEFSRMKQSVRSVSLRDVQRFLKVFTFFLLQKKSNGLYMRGADTCLLLTVFYSYYCRFNTIQIREELCEYLDKNVTKNQGRQAFKKNCKKVVDIEMNQIRNVLDLSDFYKSIAFTDTLRENLFMTMISVLNNLPIIIVGPPGSSKTLCTRILHDSMKGKHSIIKYFKNFPNLMYKTYQCSVLSTPESIEKAFKNAKQASQLMLKNSKEDNLDAQNIVALILDEVGLAEASPLNPLKVLHRLLEDPQMVPMIGLSNWSLDASKMNRVVFANRPILSQTELIDAAKAIWERIFEGFHQQAQLDQQIIVYLAIDTFEYFQSLKKQKKFLHGTRDFYNCVTYICYHLRDHIGKHDHQSIMKIKFEAILRNFGGQQKIMQTLFFFMRSLRSVNSIDNSEYQIELNKDEIKAEIEKYYNVNIEELNVKQQILKNIQDVNCRNLMIIVDNFEYALNFTEKICQNRQYKIFQGSDLQDDFTEQNALKMLNEIITCMEEGYLVIMHGLENLYQSFYDLFNQNYVELGAKKFCRIAIGADAIRGKVHSNFKAIVIAENKNMIDPDQQNYDPPLLNRFEKQYLNVKSLLTNEERKFKDQIQEFMEFNGNIKSDRRLMQKVSWQFFVREMYPNIINQEETLFSLTIRNFHQKNQKERLENSRQQLINLATMSGIVRACLTKKLDIKYFYKYINSNLHFDMKNLLDEITFPADYFVDQINEVQEDYDLDMIDIMENRKNEILQMPIEDQKNGSNIIIYTPSYDYKNFQNKELRGLVREIQMEQIENLTQLKKEARDFFNSPDKKNLIIFSSVLESRMKILYIKKTMLEEKKKFLEIFRDEVQQRNCIKNIIIVVITINQFQGYQGFLYDKEWMQIYMESTYSPISMLDDIKTYLAPISDVLASDEVFQSSIDENISSSIEQINYDGIILTEEHYLQRSNAYREFLSIRDSKIRSFVKSKIIDHIDEQCQIYKKVGFNCEWFHFVSTLPNLIRDKNNSFLSSLKHYLNEVTSEVLTKLFLVAEQNGIISSLIDKEWKQVLKNHLVKIQDIWIYLFEQLKQQSLTCDQSIEQNYPFTHIISQYVEKYRQIYMEIVQNQCQLEARINIRAYSEEESSLDEDLSEKSQINECVQIDSSSRQKQEPQKIKNKTFFEPEKDPSLNILTNVLNEMVEHFEDDIGNSIRSISEINPEKYFNNLSYNSEYAWTSNSTLRDITQMIVSAAVKYSGENLNVSIYHSLLWINEDVYKQLSPIWDLCISQNVQLVQKCLKQLCIKIDLIFKGLVNDDDSVEECIKESQNKKDNNNKKNLNFIEQIWQEILIYTSNVMDCFIIPQEAYPKKLKKDFHQQDFNDGMWLQNLKKCQGIIISFFNEYQIQTYQLIQQTKKLNFIIEISDYFSQNQNIRLEIQQKMIIDNQFVFITEQNYKNCLLLSEICDQEKRKPFQLFLIWKLTISDYFQEIDLISFGKENLKEIIECLYLQINDLDHFNFHTNEQESHVLVFTKRIMKKIIQKAFDTLEDDQIFNQDQHDEFKLLAEIFSELKIKMSDPFCSVIDDVVEEKFYDEPLILDNIGNKNHNQELIIIDQNGLENLRKFLANVYENYKGVFINLIDFVLLKQICKSVCFNIHSAYCYQNQEKYSKENRQIFLDYFQSDQKRKQELKSILNMHLNFQMNSEQLENCKINPMTPLLVCRMLKKTYDLRNFSNLQNSFDIFKDQEIFQEEEIISNLRQRKNIRLIKAFQNTIKDQKSDLLKKEIQEAILNKKLDEFKFMLICIISEFIFEKGGEQFETLIKILEDLNKINLVVDTQLLIDTKNLYLDLKQKNDEISEDFWKSFLTILSMSAFLHKDSFIKKLLKNDINLTDIYLPFVIDSDGMMQVREDLKEMSSIRRFQCTNCVDLKIKPFILNVPPCCLPMPQKAPSQTFNCPNCRIKITIEDHRSNQLLPPMTVDGLQEPILQKVATNWNNGFYNIPGFPYQYSAEILDDFIKRRGQVEKGFQSKIDIHNKKLRQISNFETILLGRMFIMPVICLQTFILAKDQGQQQAQKIVGYSEPNDFFKQIYSEDQTQSAWNLLKEIGQEEHNLSNYIIDVVVQNFIKLQSQGESLDKQPFTTDQMRIQFEQQFQSKVIDQDSVLNLRNFTDSQDKGTKQQLQEKQILRNVILKNNLEALPNDLKWIKEYKNIYRLKKSNTLLNFVKHFQIKAEGPCAQFIQQVHEFKQQIQNCSKIYRIQNWLKKFNEIAFDLIDEKQSDTIKIIDFVQNPQKSIGLDENKKNDLRKEYDEMHESWKYFKRLIDEDKLIIGPDCAQIFLDDLEFANPNGDQIQTISVFCISENPVKRGYSLSCLMKNLVNQQNIFIRQLQDQFHDGFNQIQEKTLFRMNRKNFIQQIMFEDFNSNEIFEDVIYKYFSANPLMENEKEYLYDYKSLVVELIQEQFSGICFIKECPINESEKFKLKNFRFKGDIQLQNVLGEFPDKIKQCKYLPLKHNGLTHIDISNNETRHKLKQILKMTMSILVKIQSESINGDIELLIVLRKFGMQTFHLNFEKEKMKLCHLMHVYEVIEKVEFIQLIQNEQKVNLFCRERLTDIQSDGVNEFCNQNKDESFILMEVLARLIVRHLYSQEVLMPAEGLFYRFEFVEDIYQPLWGIGNHTKFKYHVFDSNWKKKYPIFNYENENKVSLSQAFHLYKEINTFHQKLTHEKQMLEKMKMDNLRKDLQKIDKDQVLGLQHKNVKSKKKTNKSYKDKE